MARSAPSDISWLEGWEKSAPTGRDRREAERLRAYWEGKLKDLGGVVTIPGLDLAAVDSREWSNRFLISVDPVVERSALLLYGPKFAQLMGLRAKPRTDLPMMRQLTRRYGELFLHGCAEAQQEMAPARLEGGIEGADGLIEQHRAIFIARTVQPHAVP